MVLTAKEARELSNQNGFDKKVEEKIRIIENRIKSACEYGRTSTCAFGNLDNNKSDVELEVKKHFQKLGYKFKRTGMVGGVPQTTEDIYW